MRLGETKDGKPSRYLQIYLSARTAERLEDLAKHREVPKAVLVKEAVRRLLDAEQR